MSSVIGSGLNIDIFGRCWNCGRCINSTLGCSCDRKTIITDKNTNEVPLEIGDRLSVNLGDGISIPDYSIRMEITPETIFAQLSEKDKLDAQFDLVDQKDR
jgi:hypothetical protein